MKRKIRHLIDFMDMRGLSPMNRNIRLMYIYNLLLKMQFSLPIEAIYFAAVAGDFTLGMSVFAISYMTGSILSLPMGILSDIFGRKKITILCTFSRVMTAILFAIAPSYIYLVCGALFYGVYRALVSANNDALLYESAIRAGRKEDAHQILSGYRSMSAAGLSVGALLCGLFVLISLKAVMIANVVPMSIALFITFFLTEPNAHQSMAHRFENPFRYIKEAALYLKTHKGVGLYMVADASYYGLSESAFASNGNFFKTIIPEWSLGILRFCGHLTNSVTSYFSGKVGKLIGVEKTIGYFAMLDNVLNIISLLCANLLSPILKTAGSGVYGIYSPASCVYLQQNVPDKERVTLLSVASLLNCAVFSMGTLMIGYIADKSSPAMAMLVGYSLSLCSNGLYFLSFRVLNREKKNLPVSDELISAVS